MYSYNLSFLLDRRPVCVCVGKCYCLIAAQWNKKTNKKYNTARWIFSLVEFQYMLFPLTLDAVLIRREKKNKIRLQFIVTQPSPILVGLWMSRGRKQLRGVTARSINNSVFSFLVDDKPPKEGGKNWTSGVLWQGSKVAGQVLSSDVWNMEAGSAGACVRDNFLNAMTYGTVKTLA